MHCRVNPSTSLRQQHLEFVWYNSLAYGLRNENLLAFRESLEHERREVSIFAEEEQVLRVQRVDNVFRVVFNDIRVGKNWDPVVLATLGGLDAVHAETTGQTGHTTEDRLKSLSQVMRNKVPVLRLATVFVLSKRTKK